jgi:hypothetical protein
MSVIEEATTGSGDAVALPQNPDTALKAARKGGRFRAEHPAHRRKHGENFPEPAATWMEKPRPTRPDFPKAAPSKRGGAERPRPN